MRRAEDDLPETDAESDAVTISLMSTSPGPDQNAYASDIRRRVNESMGRMSATERTAFVLRHFEGHTLEHIGATLGISLAATKQSVFRAVRKVRQDLEPLVQASCPLLQTLLTFPTTSSSSSITVSLWRGLDSTAIWPPKRIPWDDSRGCPASFKRRRTTMWGLPESISSREGPI